MSALRQLKLSIKTSSKTFSGTDAHVYLVFVGTGDGRIYRVPTRPGDLEAGKLDIYHLECPEGPELETLTALLLVNGMNGSNPAWRVLWLRIEALDAQGRGWLLADTMLEQWLRSSDADAPVAFIPLRHPYEPVDPAGLAGPLGDRLVRVR